LAKLGGVFVLLSLAALNRWRLVPRFSRDARGAARALKITIAAEAALFAVIIALTAGLGSVPPPRALLPPPPVLVRKVETTGLSAKFTLSPARLGPNRLEIELHAPVGLAIDPSEVQVAWSTPEAGIAPFKRALPRFGPGRYVADGIVLPTAGRWRFDVTALTDEFTKSALHFEATIEH
jgi:copper transport protein